MTSKNIGTSDRLIRLLLACILLAFAFWQKSWLVGAASAFVFYEALAGWCIFYQFIGKNTCGINQSKKSLGKYTNLFICVVLCLSVEFSAAWFTQESVSTWYPTLTKPWWTPPNYIFPIVWTVLYLMMALSLWIITIKPGEAKSPALIVFFIQLSLNFAWSFLFFFWRDPFWAFIDISLLCIAIATTIVCFWRISRIASFLLVPYLVWVCFAAWLNLTILFLN